MDTESSDSSEFGDYIEDTIPSLEQQTEKNILKEKVHDALNHLDERLALIIALRYGIEYQGRNVYYPGTESHTLEETGEFLHITRERIRQLEAKAESELRILLTKHGLKDY